MKKQLQTKEFVQTDTRKISTESGYNEFLSKTSSIHGKKDRIMLALPKWEDHESNPCRECLVKPSCNSRCDKFSEWNVKMHKLTLIECWVNLGIHFFDNMTKIDVKGLDKSTGLPFGFLTVVRHLLRVLGYLINCKSWSDRKLYEFDRLELNSRLKNIRL
jgi:radical SAM protein with 4Fe4S-binding SPASM domain